MSDIIQTFDEALGGSSKEWPALRDFDARHVFINPDTMEDVSRLLMLGPNRRCLLRGAGGSGKTVLARIIAKDKHDNRWKVRFIDVAKIEESLTETLIREIEAAASVHQDYAGTFLVVENCHNSLSRVSREVEKMVEGHPNCSFLFTMRPVDDKHLNPFEEWDDKWVMEMTPGIDTACRILETFAGARGVSYTPTIEDKIWIGAEFGRGSIDLRRLDWYCKAWQHNWGPFRSLDKGIVQNYVLSYYHKEIANQEAYTTLLRIASVFQYDVPFDGRGCDKDSREALEKAGIIFGIPMNWEVAGYRMRHSTDAGLLIEAVAAKERGSSLEDPRVYFIRHYLKDRPLNYLALVQAIYRAGDKELFKQILEREDTLETICVRVMAEPIGAVILLMNLLDWAGTKVNGVEFWNRYKGSLGVSTQLQQLALKSAIMAGGLVDVCRVLSYFESHDAEEKIFLVAKLLGESSLLQKAIEPDSTLRQIVVLINLLDDATARSVLSGIGNDRLGEQSEQSGFFRIRWMVEDAKPAASLMLAAIDPTRLAKGSIHVTTKSLHFFLKGCLGLSANDFARIFLSTLQRVHNVPEMLERSHNIKHILGFLSIAKQVDEELYKELRVALSPKWLDLWVQSDFGGLASSMFHRLNRDVKFLDSVVNGLASADLSSRIKRLYDTIDSSPLRDIGRLLNAVHLVCLRSGSKRAESIAMQFVDNLNLTGREDWSLHQLSLILANFNLCGKDVWQRAWKVVIEQADFHRFVKVPLDRGFAFLLPTVLELNEHLGMSIIDEILELEFEQVLLKSEPESVSRMIFTLNMFVRTKVSEWVGSGDHEAWLAKVSSDVDPLWLLWALLVSDENKGRKIINEYGLDKVRKVQTLTENDIPLLGLFVYYGVDVGLGKPTVSARQLAKMLTQELDIAKLAFAVHYLSKRDETLVKDFTVEFSREWYTKGNKQSVIELVKMHTFTDSRQVIEALLHDIDFPEEPQSTLNAMVHAASPIFRGGKGKQVDYGKLQDLFLTSPAGAPLFDSIDEARFWLNIGAKCRVFNFHTITHPTNRELLVTTVSLSG